MYINNKAIITTQSNKKVVKQIGDPDLPTLNALMAIPQQSHDKHNLIRVQQSLTKLVIFDSSITNSEVPRPARATPFTNDVDAP